MVSKSPMGNPTCCCCMSLRAASLLQIAFNFGHLFFRLVGYAAITWTVVSNTGTFDPSEVPIKSICCMIMLVVGFVGAWKRKANYLRISALFELAAFLYHGMLMVYDYLETDLVDVCKSQRIHSDDGLCESSMFFYLAIGLGLATVLPFFILDLTLVITLYRYASHLTNQEYSEQQRFDLPVAKDENGSSTSLTKRFFLRKRARRASDAKQEEPSM